MTGLHDREGPLSKAKEATPSLCVAKPVHLNVLSSCLCLSLRLGNMCIYIYAGGVYVPSEGGAAGKDTLILHTEVFGVLEMLRGGEETQSQTTVKRETRR